MSIQEIRDHVAKIVAGLTAISENRFYDSYEEDRKILLSMSEIKSNIPEFIKNSPNLDIAYSCMRDHANGTGSWKKRRKFLEDNFEPMLNYLNQIEVNAPLLEDSEISQITLASAMNNVRRAKSLIDKDPASAITKIATALADVCKHILDCEGFPVSNNDRLPKLVSCVARDVLKLDKELEAPSFAAISNQVQLVAEIRNRYGDAHPAPIPDIDLAEFAVMTGATLTIFLFKRYEAEKGLL